MKGLIIGGGSVSEMFHIPACISLLGIDNTYIAENIEEQRQRIKNKYYEINIIENYKEYLNKVDFVIIATPPNTHINIIWDCINYDIPFLCEKPLSFSFEDLSALLKTCIEKKYIAGMCHTYRFFPNRLETKSLIDTDFFGKDLEIDIVEGDPASWVSITGYNFRKDLVPGGVLLDAGVHSLDFILWCLGMPDKIEYEDDSMGGLESNMRMTLMFKSGAKATFRLSRTCSLPNKIKVMGNGNCAEFGIFEMTNIIINNKTHSIDKKYPQEASNWSNIAVVQLMNFIDALKSNINPRCNLVEGANVIEVIESCYNLKKNHPKPLKLPLPGLTF